MIANSLSCYDENFLEILDKFSTKLFVLYSPKEAKIQDLEKINFLGKIKPDMAALSIGLLSPSVMR